MLIPALVVELHKTYAPFHQPSRKQAIRRIGARLTRVGAVFLKDRIGLLREVAHFGHRSLHSVSQFVLGDAAFDFGVGGSLELLLVKLSQSAQHFLSALGVDALRVAQIEDGVFTRAEANSLMLRRQKTAAPIAAQQRLARFVFGDQHDKRRQVLAGVAQAVMQPGADRGPAGQLRAGLEKRDGRAVVDRLGEHRADDAQVVGDLCGVRQQFADPRAALAMLLELIGRANHRQARLVATHAGEPLALPHAVGQFLAVVLVQQRLVIEQINLRRRAGLKEEDHPFGFGPKMGAAQYAAFPGRRTGRRADQIGQRDAAQAQA